MPLINYFNYPFHTDDNNRIGIPIDSTYEFDISGYSESVETYQLLLKWVSPYFNVSMLTWI